MAPFSPGKRVVVLGAGATKGASTSVGRIVQPPLNADFFTQVQRITADKHVENMRHVMRDVVELFGSNFRLTMEEYFTQLESFETMSSLAPAGDRSLSVGEIRKKRDRLMTVLAAVLEESTDVSKKGSDVCKHHGALIAELKARDTIISFNYDCVIDHALRREGEEKWSSRYGYSLPKPNRILGTEHWDAASPPSGSNKTINLLKLHGSLNWPNWSEDTALNDLRLKQRLYKQQGTPRFKIIPPEFVKNIRKDNNFEALWRNAERAIRHAEVLAFVGFSFVPTDLHVDALFRIALSGNSKLRSLLIANPSQEHRRRIRSVCAQALRPDVLVRQYQTLEELADHCSEGILE